MSPVPVRARRVALAIGALLLGACTVSDTKSADSTASAPPVAAQPAPAPTTTPSTAAAPDSAGATAPGAATTPQQSASKLRVEVDLKARRLHLYENGSRVESHPVAVGSSQW